MAHDREPNARMRSPVESRASSLGAVRNRRLPAGSSWSRRRMTGFPGSAQQESIDSFRIKLFPVVNSDDDEPKPVVVGRIELRQGV